MGNLNFAIIDSKSRFEEMLTNGQVDPNWLIFIEDTREIWTHNLYFGAVSLNADDVNNRLSNIESIINEIGTSEAVKQSHIVLTQEEYNERVASGTIFNDVFYYITE